jgi:hypothetical protein
MFGSSLPPVAGLAGFVCIIYMFGSSLPPVAGLAGFVCIIYMFGSSLPPVVVGGLMTYLRCLCLLAYSGCSTHKCVVFLLCFSSSFILNIFYS